MGSAEISRILVAFDGSENSFEACDMAYILAKGHNSEVILAEALPTMGIFSMPLREEYYAKLENNARATIEKAATSISRRGVKSRSKILHARTSIADSIIECSENEKCDIIVAGTRGLGGFRRMLMGSVSTDLVNRATCPVLVVRTSPESKQVQLAKLLVATDGSTTALKAVTEAVSIADSVRAELSIVNVVYLSPLAYSSGVQGTIDRVLRELREEGERIVSEGKQIAEERGIKADARMIDSGHSPVVAITELADKNEIDLIVLGTRGLGGFQKLVLGSVANGIVHYSKCSVMVVR